MDTAEDPDDVNPRADVVASEITNSHQETKKGHISPRAAEYRVLIEIPAPTAASAPVAVAVSR